MVKDHEIKNNLGRKGILHFISLRSYSITEEARAGTQGRKYSKDHGEKALIGLLSWPVQHHLQWDVPSHINHPHTQRRATDLPTGQYDEAFSQMRIPLLRQP